MGPAARSRVSVLGKITKKLKKKKYVNATIVGGKVPQSWIRGHGVW